MTVPTKSRPAKAKMPPPSLPAHAAGADAPANFDWPLANEAEQLLRTHVAAFLELNSWATHFAERLRDETGTDFFEWIDHIVLSPTAEAALRKAGFTHTLGLETPRKETVFERPGTTLPRVLLAQRSAKPVPLIALRPEFVADFIGRHNLASEPEGEPFSRFRRVVVSEENGTRLEAVERHGYGGFVTAPLKPRELSAIVQSSELFFTRPRLFEHDDEGFKTANRLLDRVLKLVDRDLACVLFFEAERAYWESRNRAARIQKHRQDLLGLGWGNHDHHTFRCSREHFADLVSFLVRLGFVKRERYYAGAEAGWGAQVSEQPVAGIVVFADVDLLPEERQIDFSVEKLQPASRLGTVGLWVGLHGESFLEAGMHHLEARFEFDLLRDQLQANNINIMKPFSDFAFLRQAFTEGERWPVRPEKAKRLLAQGLITPQQFDEFTTRGALGSHLENLQRHGGFKGFNQQSVSAIIAATDPRRNHFHQPSAAA